MDRILKKGLQPAQKMNFFEEQAESEYDLLNSMKIGRKKDTKPTIDLREILNKRNASLAVQLKEQEQGEPHAKGLSKYLRRAFEKCHNKQEQKEMRKLIINKLNLEKICNNLEKIDWNTQEAPKLLRETTFMGQFVIQGNANHNSDNQYATLEEIGKKHKQEQEVEQLIQGVNLEIFGVQKGSAQVAVDKNPAKLLQLHNRKNKRSLNIIPKRNGRYIGQEQEEEEEEDEAEQQEMEEDFNANSSETHEDSQQQQQQQRQKTDFVGICQSLEKEYYRVQGEVRAEQVRPLNVLKRALVYVRQKYERERDYCYIQNQFRSIRQDLLLQGVVREPFNLEVIEENIRVSLQNSDIIEYDKLRVELQELYQALPGLKKAEFTLCTLLYFILKGDNQGLHKSFAEFAREDLLSACVLEAQNVRDCIARGNYCKLFRLLHVVKGAGKHVVHHFINRWRQRALRVYAKAFRTSEISVEALRDLFQVSAVTELRKIVQENGWRVAPGGTKVIFSF